MDIKYTDYEVSGRKKELERLYQDFKSDIENKNAIPGKYYQVLDDLDSIDEYTSSFGCLETAKKIQVAYQEFLNVTLDLIGAIDSAQMSLAAGNKVSVGYLKESMFSPDNFINNKYYKNYGAQNSYGNSSHIPTDGKAPNVRGNDNETSQPNNNTNANQSSNGVTNNTVSGNSNNNTNADTSNNGTQRNVETEEERKRQEEEKNRQEEERKRQEEERKRQEEEKKHQEEERRRQEEERNRQEEERRRQEEEKNRQEEERKRQEEERRRQEEQGANAGNDVAIPPTPGNNGNGSNNGTTIPIPNTETHSDNPIGAGIDQVTPDKAGDGTGTSIVGEAKDLFKNRGKSTPDSKPVLPKSESTKSSTSTNSKGFNPVPLAVGLGAAVAGGVGIKAYKDHKENSSFNDENEDSFSNGNRFWSEEDPNVINSEEDMVSGDDLFNEQATSPSYSAMINNDSNSQEGWTLDEETSESNDSFDLLGDN